MNKGDGTISYHYSNTLNSNISFKFYGKKIRLYHYQSGNNRTDNAEISIDGVISNVDLNSIGSYGYGNILFYENTNLSLGIHEVRINNLSNRYLELDKVDIDDASTLLPNDYNGSISLDKSSMDLTESDSRQLTATTTPASVGVTWKSSDISIATVDSNGKVTAGSIAGTCTITATTNDGSNLSASCIVTVTPKATVPNPPVNPDLEYIVNTARAKGDNTNNASGGVSIIYKGVAEVQLSVVKTADVQSVFVGDNFTYTLVVTNTSSQIAKAVVINDNAPNHIQFTVSGVTTTQGKVDPSSTSKNIIVNAGDIPPLGTVTIKIPVTVIL